MIVLALDPGNTQTAWVQYDSGAHRLVTYGKDDNAIVMSLIVDVVGADCLAVEMIASYGMPVGREVFETCLWIGRFVERWEQRAKRELCALADHHALVYRRDVKLHLCGQSRAKDPHVRQALIDRFGPGKDKAVGTKKQPGPLYGVKADVWAAIAVAVTHSDQAQRAA